MKKDLLANNRALLEAFRRGEKQALQEVWMHYQIMVRQIAVKGFPGFAGFKNTCDIEDAICATFAAAFEERCRLSYDGISPYYSYLSGIARNVIRRLAQKQARLILLEDGANESAVYDDQNPEVASLIAEEKIILSQFRRTLDGRIERPVFEGYYELGLSEEKLAATLGITRHKVRKALASVRKKMKLYLKQHGLW